MLLGSSEQYRIKPWAAFRTGSGIGTGEHFRTGAIISLSRLDECLQRDVLHQLDSGEYKNLGEVLNGKGSEESGKSAGVPEDDAEDDLVASSDDATKDGDSELQDTASTEPAEPIGDLLNAGMDKE